MRLGITPSWFSLRLFDVQGRTKVLPCLEEGGTRETTPSSPSLWSGLPLPGEGLKDLWFLPDWVTGTDEVDPLVGLELVSSRRK